MNVQNRFSHENISILGTQAQLIARLKEQGVLVYGRLYK